MIHILKNGKKVELAYSINLAFDRHDLRFEGNPGIKCLEVTSRVSEKRLSGPGMVVNVFYRELYSDPTLAKRPGANPEGPYNREKCSSEMFNAYFYPTRAKALKALGRKLAKLQAKVAKDLLWVAAQQEKLKPGYKAPRKPVKP